MVRFETAPLSLGQTNKGTGHQSGTGSIGQKQTLQVQTVACMKSMIRGADDTLSANPSAERNPEHNSLGSLVRRIVGQTWGVACVDANSAKQNGG